MALEAAIEALGGGRIAAAPQDSRQAVATAALADLTSADLGAEDSPAQRAERDAEIARQYRIARPQGGEIAVGEGATKAPWTLPAFGESGGGASGLEGAIGALTGTAEGKEGPSVGIPGNVPAKPQAEAPKGPLENFEKPWLRRVSAPLEAALSVGSTVLAAPVAAAVGLARGVNNLRGGVEPAAGARDAQARAAEVLDALTYRPRTEEGMSALQTFGRAFEASKLGGLGPAEGMAIGQAMSQIPKGGVSQGVRLALGVDQPLPAPQAAAPAAAVAPRAMGSAGAAGTTPQAAAEALAAQAKTPEVAASIKQASQHPDFNLRAAERIVEADTLPVPVRLTRGQASQDPAAISIERNRRATSGNMVARLNEQNKQLIENTDAIRDIAAPDVYATSKPAMGESLIDAYKAKDAALNKTISANYKALKDANGGAFPMDSKAFAEAAYKKLHADLKAEFVPAGIEKQLDGFRAGKPMTFEQFEAMRTNLANVMRSSADGNAKQAASLIRDALEELPMPAGAEHLKPLADAARASARERFAMLDADPAFKAVVRGKAVPDTFVDRFVLNPTAATDKVRLMRENLAHDPVAQQTMTAGALARLREKAGILSGDARTEAFSPAGYNKALEGMRSKLDVLFQPESKALVERLGNVANYVKAQPAGSFVNNSNTAVAALGELAQSGAEALANKYSGGMYGLGKRGVEFLRERKDLARSLQTGAGLRLSEIK